MNEHHDAEFDEQERAIIERLRRVDIADAQRNVRERAWADFCARAGLALPMPELPSGTPPEPDADKAPDPLPEPRRDVLDRLGFTTVRHSARRRRSRSPVRA